ncbi:Sodium/hydrogen exchanger 3 [Phytophthora pseudosyringae]|uniref:Sodium/hydrogen exchanger 3 n=1 Tax=Phytophthora pseudosyringae TaxID=221518 RepID=A0A8T1VRB9_9STRA|nr:Sodium/hydrogen exchanger 3 [Phytophthora pseudosyringae]
METVSEEMQALYEAQRRAHETVLALQTQVEDEEAVYLEETPHGNIIRGWDGFIDSKQPRKDANPKKIKPYTEAEHLFSSCCFYASMAGEPSFDQVDIYDTTKDDAAGRRKLTVTLSVGKGTGASGSVSGVVDSATTHGTHAAYRGGKGSKLQSAQKTTKAANTHPVTGKGAAATSTSSYQHSKASKLKKRKREAEAVATAMAQETTATGPQAAAATATTGTAAQAGASDFLDVL